jgi:hypothetical protein
VLVDNKYIMITVSGFSDYAQTLKYFNAFQTDKIVRNASAAKMTTFIISDKNLNTLATDKNPGRYQLFFIENYLK